MSIISYEPFECLRAIGGREVGGGVKWFWFHRKQEAPIQINVLRLMLQTSENYKFARNPRGYILWTGKFLGMFLLPTSDIYLVDVCQLGDCLPYDYRLHFGSSSSGRYGTSWWIETVHKARFDTLPECETWIQRMVM